MIKEYFRGRQRTKGRIRRRVTALLCAAGIAVAGLVAAPPANAWPTSNVCDFGVFIGVRGTGAPGGSGLAHSNRVWTSGGMGTQVQPIANHIAGRDMPFYFESLNYPATAANYSQSVAIGSANLINELNWLANACGTYIPAVVLVGHSQGAHVISDALGGGQWPNGPTLSAKAKNIINGVVFLGDPQYWPTDSWNAPYSPQGYGVFQRNLNVSTQLATYRYWGWSQGSSNPNPSWQPKIRSYCAAGDFFCQNNPGDANFTIHNSYKNTTALTAANWLEYRLVSPI